MLKGAFLVETSAELLIEVALGHLGHIVFVKKLAIVALLTETAKPMLAHYGPIASDVSIRTHSFPLAVSSEMEVANCGCGLVHAGKRVGQNSHMVVQGDLDVEDVVVIDGAHQVHHFRAG